MAKAQVKFRITGDTSGLKKATTDAQGIVGSFSGKVKGLLGPMAAAAGTAFATDKIVAFGGEIFGLSSQLSTWKAKSASVFEDQGAAVRKWADQNNEAFGVSVQELEGLTASFGDLLKPMGFTASETASMSKDVVGLSGALSAWTGGNKSAAEVTDILAKAMLGERDGLVELGIKISDLDVQQKLAAKGQDKLTGAALEQAKAVATQELIFAKSTDAQKAWANGSLDAQKNTNKLKATFADFKAQIAEKATPWIQKGVEWLAGPGVAMARRFAGGVQSAITPIVDWFRRHWGQISAVVSTVGKAWLAGWRAQIGAAKQLIAGITAAWQRWGPAVKAVASRIRSALEPVIAWLSNAWAKVSAAIERGGGIGKVLRSSIGSAFRAIVPIVQSVAGAIGAFWDRFGPKITAAVGNIVGAVRVVVTRVAQIVGAIVFAIVKVAQDLWTRFGKHIIDFGRTLWENLGQVFGGLIDIISGVFGLIKNILTGQWGAAWDSVKQILSGAWNVILGVIQTAWGLVQTVLGGGLAVISTLWGYAWGGIKAVASAIWDGIKAVVGAAIDGVRAIISWHVDGIKAVWNAAWGAIKAVVSTVWDGIKLAVSTAVGAVLAVIRWHVDLIKAAWNAAWSAVKSVVGAVWDWITGTVQSGVDRVKGVIDGIKDLGSNAWDAFKNAAKAAFNAIARLWNNSVGKLSFSAPDWVPVVGGKSFAVPKIPELASGGVVTRPTLAVIGEYPGARSDPEIVSPRSMMVEAVREAVGSTGAAPGQPIVVQVQLDGRLLTEVMVPRLRAAL